MEPISTLAVAGISWLFSASSPLSPSTAISSAIAGIIGNRADHNLCKSVGSLQRRLQGLNRTPENEDVARAVRKAQLRALNRVIRDYKGTYYELADIEGQNSIETFVQYGIQFCKKEFSKCKDKKGNLKLSIAASLASAIDGIISESVYGSSSAYSPVTKRRDALATLAEEAVLNELRNALEEANFPAGFEIHFRRGNERSFRFLDLFGHFIAEEIKTNERFRSILMSGQLSRIEGLAVDTAEILNQSARTLDRISADTSEIRRATAATLSGVEELVKTLGYTGAPFVASRAPTRKPIRDVVSQIEKGLFEVAIKSVNEILEYEPDRGDLYYYLSIAMIGGKPLHRLSFDDVKDIVEKLNTGRRLVGSSECCATLLLVLKRKYFGRNGVTWFGSAPDELICEAKRIAPEESKRLARLLNVDCSDIDSAIQ